MRTFALFSVLLVCGGRAFADYYATSNYFCRDLNRQTIVDINQLQGIWYLIQKINHTDYERFLVKLHTHTCPIIHISTHQSDFNKSPPQSRYASRYPVEHSIDQSYHTTPNYKTQKPQHSILYIKYHLELRYLRMYWDENGRSIEYKLKYNVHKPGFWISSSFEEAMQRPSAHFAGTVQVLKAVGNHLVLTFCYSLPEAKQFFTLILSRQDRLEPHDVENIHGLLTRQNLRVDSLEDSCNGSDAVFGRFNLNLVFTMMVGWLFLEALGGLLSASNLKMINFAS